MNITGYKKKRSIIIDTIKTTENQLSKEKRKSKHEKDEEWIEGMKAKLETLYKAKHDCMKQIKSRQKKYVRKIYGKTKK